jgi:hypothetical protein
MMVREITLLSKCYKINTETFSSELICRRFRATTKYFVYIARYEKGKLEMIGENSTLRIKGQFSEKFERKRVVTTSELWDTRPTKMATRRSYWICQPL